MVAGALWLPALGYLMLTKLDNNASGVSIVIAGFLLAYLGLRTITALGADLVVGSTPADKAGSASMILDTVQEFGIPVLGRLATTIYRRTMLDRIPESLGHAVHEAVGYSLWAESSVALELPPCFIEEARAGLMAVLSLAVVVSTAGISLLTVLSSVSLRHISVIDETPPLQ